MSNIKVDRKLGRDVRVGNVFLYRKMGTALVHKIDDGVWNAIIGDGISPIIDLMHGWEIEGLSEDDIVSIRMAIWATLMNIGDIL